VLSLPTSRNPERDSVEFIEHEFVGRFLTSLSCCRLKSGRRLDDGLFWLPFPAPAPLLFVTGIHHFDILPIE
jgi:hypothetical protein